MFSGNKVRLNNIQIGRGIAAIIVVFHHLLLPQMQMIAKDSIIFEIFHFNILGDFAVYFFFCVSGYVMMLSCNSRPKTSIQFIKDRITRIFPLYIVCTILSLTIYFSTRNDLAWVINLNFIPRSITEYISVFTLFPPIFNSKSFALPLGTAWSLVYEMYYYIIFAILLFFMNSKNIPLFLLVIFFSSFVIVNSFFEPARHRWVFWPYIISDFVNLCFAVGAVLYRISENESLKIAHPLLAIILILITVILLPVIHDEKITLSILSCICFYLLLNYKPSDNKFNTILVYLGNASYSIYLTHIVFNSISWRLIKLNPWFGFGLTVFAIVFGCIIHELLEKPLMSIFRVHKKKFAS